MVRSCWRGAASLEAVAWMLAMTPLWVVQVVRRRCSARPVAALCTLLGWGSWSCWRTLLQPLLRLCGVKRAGRCTTLGVPPRARLARETTGCKKGHFRKPGVA
jgi:hypothetical protein